MDVYERSTRAARVRKLWKRLGTVDGFMEGASIFSDSDDDRAYFVNGTQVANLVGDSVALRLTRKVVSAHRARLKAEPSVDLLRSGSDWIGVSVTTARDADLVLELAALVAEAHLPSPGTPVKPPPEGAELARRRRFH
ncbi:MAG TPA: hypothetical protein VM345_18860 [Acidimicrobiales bacterium]|jgi:hypothetical protein|nr:hypothetical protein [Acidimicrobiales bacterium]